MLSLNSNTYRDLERIDISEYILIIKFLKKEKYLKSLDLLNKQKL